MDHRDIITGQGGIRALARKLEHPSHTTVQGWFERNQIPLDRWAELISATDKDEKPLTTADLLPPELRPEAA